MEENKLMKKQVAEIPIDYSAMENTCICCGAIIPEGRQVCPICERRWPEF
jgi:hypothetical protein